MATETEIVALCMKCKHNEDENDKQVMQNVSIQEKGGRYSARGECPVCETGMFKFMSKDDAVAYAEETGTEVEHVEA